MTGEWTRLRNEELHDLYCRVIRPRRMKWAWHVARMGEKSCVQGEPEGKRPLENTGIDGRGWILRKSVGRAQIGSVWLRIGTYRALVKAVTNLPVPQNARNFLTS